MRPREKQAPSFCHLNNEKELNANGMYS